MKADTDFPYSANGRGETPLYIAAASGNDNMVAEILGDCPSRPMKARVERLPFMQQPPLNQMPLNYISCYPLQI